jgi:hypothetical protein
VLVPQAGRVTVALTELLSSDGVTRVLVLGAVSVFLLAGRKAGEACSPDTSRVPNFALAEDSRA